MEGFKLFFLNQMVSKQKKNWESYRLHYYRAIWKRGNCYFLKCFFFKYIKIKFFFYFFKLILILLHQNDLKILKNILI
jgi:hypothetical protein